MSKYWLLILALSVAVAGSCRREPGSLPTSSPANPLGDAGPESEPLDGGNGIIGPLMEDKEP